MSEQLNHPEHIPHSTPEQDQPQDEQERKIEHAEAKPEKTIDELENIQRSIEHHAKTTAETGKSPEATEDERPTYLTREIKQEALAHTLKRVQHNLSPLGRTFSKVIHSKAINNVSEVTGKTIGRPSGILGGALAASIGSLTILMAARHYGFSYNYGVVIWLFLAGFVSGFAIEIAMRTGRRLKR